MIHDRLPDAGPHHPVLPDPALHDDGVASLLTRAMSDAGEVARAEIALQKARLTARLAEGRSALVFLVGALVTASMTLTAVVVGALLILQSVVGPGWATVIVVGVLLLVTGILGWLALRHVKLVFGTPGAKP